MTATRVEDRLRPTVERAVQSVLAQTPKLRHQPELERRLSEKMISVSLAAADLLAQDKAITEGLARRRGDRRPSTPRPLARAQAAADMNSGRAVNQAPDALQRAREAIDFPTFVTSLITGVFQAIQTSSIQQLQAVVELMEAVGASADEFSTSNISSGRAATWARDRFGVFRIDSSDGAPQLVLRDDAELPEREVLMATLDASGDEVDEIDDGDLAGTLLPLVQRKLGRERQSMLATMVMMGLQRVVVDDGNLHASMHLQIDARSIAEQREAEQFDTRVETEASGSFGVGNWGASAKMSASVGYVSSDDQYSREDLALQAGLRSSVNLRFRTLPFDVRHVAGERTIQEIQNSSLNPDGPTNLLATNPTQLTAAPTMPTLANQGELLAEDRGTMAAAEKAREDAQAAEQAETAETAETQAFGAPYPPPVPGHRGQWSTSIHPHRTGSLPALRR